MRVHFSSEELEDIVYILITLTLSMCCQSWIEEMSEFVKKEDPYHLVTIGSEGFFAGNSPYAEANPHDWAEDSGQDWMPNHQAPNIDFATIHVWPDNWNRCV